MIDCWTKALLTYSMQLYLYQQLKGLLKITDIILTDLSIPQKVNDN